MFMFEQGEVDAYVQTRDFTTNEQDEEKINFQDEENVNFLDEINESYDFSYFGGDGKISDVKFPLDRCYKLNNMKLRFEKSLEYVKDLNKILGMNIYKKTINNTLRYKLYKETMVKLIDEWKYKNNAAFIPKNVMDDIRKTAKSARYEKEDFRFLYQNAREKIFNLNHLLNFEKQLVQDNYVIYHGTSTAAYVYLLFNNILENIYKSNDGSCSPFNMFNLRYNNGALKYYDINHFKNDYSIENFKLFHEQIDEKNGEWNDTLPSLKSFIISTNIFLFGNFSHPGECTASYYMTSLTHTSSDFIINMMKDNLIECTGDLYSKKKSVFDVYFVESVKKLITNIEKYYEENIVLQISFPRKKYSFFDQFNYLSIPGGGYIDIFPSDIYEDIYNKDYQSIRNRMLDFLTKLSPKIRAKFDFYLADKDGNLLPNEQLLASLQLRTLFSGELMGSADVLVNETIPLNVKSSLIYNLANIINNTLTEHF